MERVDKDLRSEVKKAVEVLREVMKKFPTGKIWTAYDDYLEEEFEYMDPEEQCDAVFTQINLHFYDLLHAVCEAFDRAGIQYIEDDDETHLDKRGWESIRLGVVRVGDCLIQAEYVWDYEAWNLYFDGITVIEDYTGDEWDIED